MTVIDIRTARRAEPSVAEAIIDEHRRGFAALLLTGRSLVDFDVDADGHIRACVEILRRRLFDELAIHLTTYSLAAGFEWSGLSGQNQAALEKVLRRHGLLDTVPDENEAVRIMRGVLSLARQPAGFKWEDGRDARVGFLFEFGEHLTPCTVNGAPTRRRFTASSSRIAWATISRRASTATSSSSTGVRASSTRSSSRHCVSSGCPNPTSLPSGNASRHSCRRTTRRSSRLASMRTLSHG